MDQQQQRGSLLQTLQLGVTKMLKEILMIKNLKSNFKVKAKGKSSFKQKPKDHK